MPSKTSAHRQPVKMSLHDKAMFEAMFNSITDAVVFADTERRIVMINPAVHKMFGYSDKELIGQTTEILYVNKQDFSDQGRRRYRTGPEAETAPYEIRYRRKDGTVFLTETLGTQVKDANGVVIGFIAMFRDITRRKQSEQALQDSESRIRMIIESALDAIIVIDNNSVIKEWNPRAEAIFGWKLSEIIGQTLMETIIPPQYRQAHTQGMENLLKTGKGPILNRRKELTALHKKGYEFPMELTILPLRHDGSWTFSAFVRDLTERKRANDALKESENRFRQAFEDAALGMSIVGLKGQFIQVNDFLCQLLGFSEAELLSMSFPDVTHPDDLQIGLDKMRQMLSGEIKNVWFEKRYVHKLGQTVWVMLSATLLYDECGEPLYFLTQTQDITKRKQAEEKLRASEQELSAILDSMQDTYYRIDNEGCLTRVSPSVRQLLGYSLQQLLGTKLADLYVDPQGRGTFLAEMEKRGGAIENFEAQLRHRDGSIVWVSTNAHYIRDEQGNPIGIEGTARDVSLLKSTEELRSRFGRILDNSTNEIYIFNAETLHFIQVNRGARQNLGYAVREMKELTPLDIKPDFTQESFTELVKPLRQGKQDQVIFQTRHRRKDGSLYPVEIRLQLSRQESPPVFVAFVMDITERTQIEQQLQYMAHHDALTALPNRVLFTDRLSQSLAHAERRNQLVAVLFMDLDRFKLINDTMGHDFGDRALQALAGRLNECVRAGDTVARLGGDEFAIVLDDIASADDVVQIARKILSVLSRSFELDEREFFITTSIGISLFPLDGKDTETLLKHADIAMYRSKDQGRNTYQFYSSDMSAKTFERLSMETNLRHALERKEFILYYQPQIDLLSARVTGVEALLRWQHPDLGLIMPREFIPILEDTGLIIPVGEWVLHNACLQARAWNDTELKPLRMSVNLSSRQFNEPKFVDMLGRVLEDTGLKPSLLELEITESILMQNVGTTISTLNAISDMGIRLAVDDFGTGYSSLSYLKRFPIDTLKIDQSFIHDIMQDPDDAKLVEAIIALGRALHLNIIAEGVETEAQADFLRSHNCDCLQGYLLYSPQAAQDLEKQLRGK